MDSFVIEGGAKLAGEISVSGNKNAALPMLAASLLTSEPVILDNVPDIIDVRTMHRALQDLGAQVTRDADGRMSVQSADDPGTSARSGDLPGDARELRPRRSAARSDRRAELSVPGGDKIGRRPLDSHIDAFRSLGVTVDVSPDRYCLSAPHGLKGCDIFLSEMSVMATENTLMAATLARGTTILRNAASEPHVQDLCRCWWPWAPGSRASARRRCASRGSTSFTAPAHASGPDYLEVGSFIALAALTGGELLIAAPDPMSTGSPRSRMASSARVAGVATTSSCPARSSRGARGSPWRCAAYPRCARGRVFPPI